MPENNFNEVSENITKNTRFSIMRFLSRFWVIMLTIVLVISAIGVTYGMLKIKPTYRAETNVIFYVTLTEKDYQSSAVDDNIAKAFTSSVADIIKSKVTATRATEIYNQNNPGETATISNGSVSVEYNKEDLILRIGYSDSQPSSAEKKLEAVIQAANEVIAADTTISAREKGLTEIQNRFDVSEHSRLVGFIVMAVAMGLVVAVLVAFLISILDNKLKEDSEVEAITGVSVLTHLKK